MIQSWLLDAVLTADNNSREKQQIAGDRQTLPYPMIESDPGDTGIDRRFTHVEINNRHT